MSISQTASPIKVFSSLADDTFALASVSWTETMGTPFAGDVFLLSEEPDIDLKALIKQPLSIHIQASSDAGMWLHGFVSRFESNGSERNYFAYSAHLVSCFGLLQHSGGCRIFQEISTPDIIKKVFELHGLTGQLESRLTKTYAKRLYCVQYRESDLSFLQRLMEEEGIYYFFEYDEKKHTMVLADDVSAHKPFAGYETIAYHHQPRLGIDEYVTDYAEARDLVTGVYALSDYDFEKPRSPLLVQQKSPLRETCLEWFDYPGGYNAVDDGTRLARVLMESADAASQAIHFNGNARGLRGGSLFTLANHPSEALNKKYLTTAATISIQASGLQVGDPSTFQCSCRLTCLDSQVPFRSSLRTPRPKMSGPHLATVSGKAGEEIWTDSYGRIKVQFPWDRDGKSDELSSCWIRVAQAWTGKNWGSMALPRIGDEVIVEFIDGNPDRPIVIGRVYNAERMPPEDLSAAQAKTVFRTRSTKGADATAFHELTFDDTKGSEQILFQSERDFYRVVENNDSLKVGFDKKEPGDRTVEIYNNETITVGLGSGTGSYALEAGKSIVLKVGDSKIEMTATGIQISAPSIAWKATGELTIQGVNITVSADAALKLLGKAGCNVESPAETVVKGAVVKIN